MLTNTIRNTQYATLATALGSVDDACCANCLPDRVCAWDCEQGLGVLEILLGQALAEQARLAQPIVMPDPSLAPISEALWETYN